MRTASILVLCLLAWCGLIEIAGELALPAVPAVIGTLMLVAGLGHFATTER